MTKISGKVDIEEMKDALQRSGYLIESRVEALLREKKFYVSANSTYPDPITGKTREFDIFASKTKSAGPREYEEVTSHLIFECVNNPQPLVFFKKKPNLVYPFIYDNKLSGLPIKIYRDKEKDWMPIRLYINMLEYHHYYKGDISTQYCSFAYKKDFKKWIACHEEEHFDVLRKLPIITEYYIEKDYKDWNIKPECPVIIHLYYPVVIVQGNLMYAEEIDGRLKIEETNSVTYCMSTIINNEENMYTIDVINEKHLESFLNTIEQELEETATRLNTVNDSLLVSIMKIHSDLQQLSVTMGHSINLRKALEPERMFK